MSDFPRRPPRRPPPETGFFQRLVAGNVWTILALLCLVILLFSLFRSRKTELSQPESPPPVVVQGDTVPSPAPTATPKEVARAEPADEREEDPTPEFVKRHTENMLIYLVGGVAGVKMSIPHEKDPRKIQEMEDRVKMGERLIKKLEAVDPNDKSTWFFLERGQGVPKDVDKFIVPRASNLGTPPPRP